MMRSRRSPRPRACSFSTTPRRALARPTRAAGSARSGLATATSFFPAKPLGCYGDGGAIFTDDDELADTLRSVRVHGQGSDKYDNVRLGLTGRLDTMQAAVLIEKLKIFPDEIAARNAVAKRYARGLGNVVTVPRVAAGCTSVWAQYTIRLPKGTRSRWLRRGAEGAGHSDRDLLCASRCISRPPIAISRSPTAACRSARRCRPRSSACRCMPISTKPRRTGSSRRACALGMLAAGMPGLLRKVECPPSGYGMRVSSA